MKTMSIPGFAAEASLSRPNRRFEMQNSNDRHRFSRRERVEPAIPGQGEQAYRDCLADCQAGGGTLTSCAKQCTPRSSGGGSTGSGSSASALCQVEFAAHPIGAAIMDGIVRSARDHGRLTNKKDCYDLADAQGGITGAIASGIGNAVGGFFGGFIGAAVAFNSVELGHCICDRYF